MFLQSGLKVIPTRADTTQLHVIALPRVAQGQYSRLILVVEKMKKEPGGDGGGGGGGGAPSPPIHTRTHMSTVASAFAVASACVFLELSVMPA